MPKLALHKRQNTVDLGPACGSCGVEHPHLVGIGLCLVSPGISSGGYS
jgi:hypothetical protein